MPKFSSICVLLILHIGVLSTSSCQNTPKDPALPAKKTQPDTTKRLPPALIDLLFADQRFDAIMGFNAKQPKQPHSVWSQFEDAWNFIQAGKKDSAKKILKAMADDKDAESRVALWAWNGLREIGEPAPVPVVLGMVLEVPQANGCDYLAVYADKRARYINALSGGAIWEKREATADRLIEGIISSSQQYVFNHELPVGRRTSPTQRVRFSFLTTAGVMPIEESFDKLDANGNALKEIFTLSTQMLAYIMDASSKQ